jgi:hypothetical protein
MKNLDYTTVKVGEYYYCINRKDRCSNIENHRFLMLKVRGVLEREGRYIVYLSENIKFTDYKLYSSELLEKPLFKTYNGFMNIALQIKSLNKMPCVIKDDATGLFYTLDKEYLKPSLKELVEAELKQIKIEKKEKESKEKDLLEILKTF